MVIVRLLKYILPSTNIYDIISKNSANDLNLLIYSQQ